jgi:hypothetical protein
VNSTYELVHSDLLIGEERVPRPTSTTQSAPTTNIPTTFSYRDRSAAQPVTSLNSDKRASHRGIVLSSPFRIVDAPLFPDVLPQDHAIYKGRDASLFVRSPGAYPGAASFVITRQ